MFTLNVPTAMGHKPNRIYVFKLEQEGTIALKNGIDRPKENEINVIMLIASAWPKQNHDNFRREQMKNKGR